jgi:hypothetical protein
MTLSAPTTRRTPADILQVKGMAYHPEISYDIGDWTGIRLSGSLRPDQSLRPSGRRWLENVWLMPCASIATTAAA